MIVNDKFKFYVMLGMEISCSGVSSVFLFVCYVCFLKELVMLVELMKIFVLMDRSVMLFCKMVNVYYILIFLKI